VEAVDGDDTVAGTEASTFAAVDHRRVVAGRLLPDRARAADVCARVAGSDGDANPETGCGAAVTACLRNGASAESTAARVRLATPVADAT
jgi:hypothetical protein